MARLYTAPDGTKYPLTEAKYDMTFKAFKSDRRTPSRERRAKGQARIARRPADPDEIPGFLRRPAP